MASTWVTEEEMAMKTMSFEFVFCVLFAVSRFMIGLHIFLKSGYE